ncbi:MAG TPA: secretin N-terminal domain-containing protein, partial [Blastocatellia bacterium]|nr:secretin N-terminal domain-containing protein [Blastocatellia bacterium]
GRTAQPKTGPGQTAAQPNTSAPKTTAPATQPQSQSRTPAAGVASNATPSQLRPVAAPQRRPELAFCDPGYVGGPISFDLRAGVDIRDMLRFISQQYGINFIVDKSVGTVGVDIRVTEIPWNQAIESVLRANRLGAVCESDGKIIRIATLAAIKEEREQQLAVEESRKNAGPLVTKIKHLRYARAAGSLSATGSGRSGGGGGGGGSSFGGGGGGGGGSTGGGSGRGTGSLLKIIESRLSKRGKIEVDGRTNSLIITDVPESFDAIDEMIALLDRPEPQVEIEARIVIANRGFLRDLGNELGAAAVNSHQGATGFFQTSPLQISNGGLVPGDAGGAGGGGGGGGGGGAGGGAGGASQNGLGPNLAGQVATGTLRAAAPSSVLALTTGLLGTSIISMTITAHERKGQIRTIATPRITAQDNQTAEIVNGVQIPIQTVSNNTITTTFVTAALRLEITPQIVEDTGDVMIHVVAENNSVNTAIAQALGSGIPGIDTQSAESTVRVSDGGTTVMGGITVDREAYSTVRTPGISRVPILGNVFKRKTTEKNSDEILFFITPRIVRSDGSMAPANLAPQRSSAQPGPANPTDPKRAAASPATTPAPPVTAGAGVGQAKK